MQAIETKYLGPTNFKGSRIKASCQAKSVTTSYEYRGNEEEHDAAARALITKLGWFGLWARGGKFDDTGNVYVCIRRLREVETHMHTPPPQAVSPLDYIVVRKPEVTP